MSETAKPLRAPFPYFGGKSRVAHEVWARFGNTPNYVEPFAGSLAVLLARPEVGRTETVNDMDCYISNFWRALQADPDAVAEHCGWPLIECDLEARRAWVFDVPEREAFRERMYSDHTYYDAELAGWWVWGIGACIGGGWMPHKREGKKGIYKPQMRNLSVGYGIHTPALRNDTNDGVYEWLSVLAHRLRLVNVRCGDWSGLASSTVAMCNTYAKHACVFLDPPYDPVASDCTPDLYDLHGSISGTVRDWAIKHGDNPLMRIALCGLEGEHEMLETWECVPWKASGGYATAHRERIWFSPHCLTTAKQLELV